MTGLTDITPYRSDIHCVVPPHEQIDELDETLGAVPENEQNTADVPRWRRQVSTQDREEDTTSSPSKCHASGI